MCCSKRLVLLVPVALILLNTPSLAEIGECRGFDDLSPPADIGIAAVTAKRGHFVKDSVEDASCPSALTACRDPAYLVRGDEVVISREYNGFMCTVYIGRNRRMRFGWLPVNSITRRPPDRPRTIRDWLGDWSFHLRAPRVRGQGFTIARSASNPAALYIEGNATYADDMAAASRGNVNTGNISADVIPDGATLAFTYDFEQERALPYDHPGDEWSCRIQMRLVGPYLLANDSGRCGGLNVTFRGVYRRER